MRAISLEDPELNSVALSLNNLSGVVAVDYYSRTDSIFWTDVLQNTINTAKIDVSFEIRKDNYYYCPTKEVSLKRKNLIMGGIRIFLPSWDNVHCYSRTVSTAEKVDPRFLSVNFLKKLGNCVTTVMLS